ncbi:MAG: SurA N-terminal domain-containing protein [Puniceicoccales bacterium]|jgi:hypothetical protein|nr:SurA N-terminal domain-containing protein [Puniceicoccales bacterium]
MLKFFFKISTLFIVLRGVTLYGFIAQKNVYQNWILAHVEDAVITKQQIEIEVSRAKQGKYLNAQSEAELHTKVLNVMIEKKIIVKEFDRMKGKLPENHVQKKYDEILKLHCDNDRLKFAEALQKQGKTTYSFKDEIRENAIVSFMYERNVIKPNTVSPLEIKHYYDTNRSKLIQERQFSIDQVMVTKENEEAITTIKSLLQQNLSYEKCCSQLTKIPGITVNHMDDLAETDVLPVITEKIATMSTYSFDNVPVDCGNQWIFLGLQNVKNAHALSLHEARNQIEHTLLGEKYQTLQEAWINTLKKKAYYVLL